MIYGERIEGNRIYLRDINASDCADRYLSWMNEPTVNQYLESRHRVQTIDSLKQFVSGTISSNDNYMFAVIYKPTDEHVGNIKIGPIHPIYKNAFIGYLIGEEEYWGKGLATEAINLATKFCFERLMLNKVAAGVYATNIGSKRALEKKWLDIGREIASGCG